jgi:mono/diheme cytochrome c family protein
MKIGAVFFMISAMLVLSFGQTITAQDQVAGKKIYLTYCSGCHGESGKGDGPAAASLPVKPADHTDGQIMSKHSDQYLFDIIAKGGQGVQKSSLMPAWNGQLKEKEIREVLAFIRSLAKASKQ